MNAKSHQGRMDFGHDKIAMNVEADRLSSLPDELIHKILSFISIKHVIRTSVLSSRWRPIWTLMPYLNFSSEDLSFEFVSNVLSLRNNQVQVSSVKLGPWESVSHESVKIILEYAFSRNVKQVTVICDLESNTGFPLSIFTSHSLEHLTMSGALCASSPFMETPTWDLPALTTLHLDHITLSDKYTYLFYKCTNLQNLSLRGCRMIETNVLSIRHTRLCNLTLGHTYWWVKVFKVVAPQLKNLTITNCYGKHVISAPGLTSLVMKGRRPMQLFTKGFPSLEKVGLCISHPCLVDAHKIVRLLRKLHNVKFLTLNLEILELFLSSSMELMSHQPSPFANLKILKFLTSSPAAVYMEVQAHKKVTKSTKITKNLPNSFQSVIFTMISCEEIRTMRSIISAQQLVAELRVQLQQCKELSDTNKAHMGRANAPMESCKAQANKQWTQSPLEMQWHFGERMTQMYKRKIEGLLMTKLQHIEGLLTKLPVKKSVVMQATFSSLCEEADVVTDNMLDSMKIRYSKKPRRLDV